MNGLQISLDTSGLTTAQQIRAQLAASRLDAIEARRQMVDRHARELSDLDASLGLYDLRIAELDEFILFKKSKG